MKIRDYIRLASAGFWRQKWQTLKVMLILGSIFIFVLTMGFLTWGAEKVGIEKSNQPTGQEILVYTEVNTEKCQSDCEAEIAAVRENVQKFGGTIIDGTGVLTTKDGELDVLPEATVQQAIETEMSQKPAGVKAVLMPTKTAIDWTGILGGDGLKFNEVTMVHEYGAEASVETIEQVREQMLGKIIVSPTGEEYFVAGFLPSDVQTSPGLYSENGFLNLFISRTPTGQSKNLIVIDEIAENRGQRVWATFKNVNDVYAYYRAEDEKCTQFGSANSECLRRVASPFGFGLDSEWSYQPTEDFFWLIAIILSVLALIVNIITLVRLTERDAETGALYYAMGARPAQVRMVQILRMVCLSLLTSIFVLIMGVVICLVINVCFAEILAEAYALGFGTLTEPVILLGWDWAALGFIGVIFLAVPIAMLSSWQKLASSRRLRDKL